jgi:hypothetical protein
MRVGEIMKKQGKVQYIGYIPDLVPSMAKQNTFIFLLT